MSGQSAFTNAVLHADRPVPAGLIDPKGRPAGKRFDVYRNNVVISLRKALETGFPVLRKLVGDDFFAAMAELYVRNHPPTSPLLMHYGRDIPVFLEHFPYAAHLPYLPDVARLELALRHSYHAADIAPIAPENLALDEAALARATLTFAPAMVLLRSRFPVASLWHANTDQPNLKVPDRGENVLITRPEYDPVVQILPGGGGVFVEALQQGHSIQNAAERASAAIANFDLAGVLGMLIAGHAITGVTIG